MRGVHAAKVADRAGFLASKEGVLAPLDFKQSINKSLQGQSWRPSDAVKLAVPQIAENGAIVPITVESLLPDTRRVLIFAEKNPNPLLAEFKSEPAIDAWISLRVKLKESGPVVAVVESGGRYYGVKALVRVMQGGCG